VADAIRTLRRMSGSGAGTRRASAGGSGPSAGLQAIAACESGGDPAAVSAGGTYRGKYQFDHATWQSVGGTGDPAAAPEAEQDARAAALAARQGASPWPNCG
jgi:soluble lytic murein transglycosylase-like protein